MVFVWIRFLCSRFVLPRVLCVICAFFMHYNKVSCSCRLFGLVAKASASRAADPDFDSRLRRRDFSMSSHTNDLRTGAPVATLPGTWRYRVSTWTGWPGVTIL